MNKKSKKISFEDGERISKNSSYKRGKNIRRKKARRKNFIGAIIAIIILVVLLVFVIGIVSFIGGRLSKIKRLEIDKNDLEVNANLLDELSGKVTESEFKDIVTVALFGSDSRNTEDMSSGRADSIIIASLNPKNKSIKLLSIPRDTYVNVPGYGWTKINHAYSYGGEQLLIKTINSNFGLAITEFATIDFLGLANIINAIGGIELEISKAEMDVINSYLKEIYELEDKPYVAMTKYGKVTLNGEQAVAHCRNRYVGNDFNRAERQRDVIMACVDKVSTMSIDKSLDVLDTGLEQITTNVDVTSYLGKITNVLTNIKEYKNNIISAQVPSKEYGYDKYIDGVYYYKADLSKAKQEFISYIYEK